MVKAVVPNLCRVFSMGVFMHWWLAERSSTKFVQGLFNGGKLASGEPLGESWERLGSLLGSLGGVLGVSRGILGASWEPLGKLFEVSERPLGRSWAPLGDFWEKVRKKDPQINSGVFRSTPFWTPNSLKNR